MSFRESAWELELLRGRWDGAWVLGEDSDPLGQMCDKKQKRQGAFISLLSFPVSFVWFFWPRWVSLAAHRCSLVVGHGLLLLQSLGSRHTGPVVTAYGLSCPEACGIFSNQGLNPCALHWQVDS